MEDCWINKISNAIPFRYFQSCVIGLIRVASRHMTKVPSKCALHDLCSCLTRALIMDWTIYSVLRDSDIPGDITLQFCLITWATCSYNFMSMHAAKEYKDNEK